MAKVKSYTSYLTEGSFTVKDVISLSFFNLLGKNTKGTSNKQYYMEIDEGSSFSQIYYCYGPVGGSQTIYYEKFDSYIDAKKEFDKVLKSKLKKGYVEVDVAQRVIGTESAKKIIKPVELKNLKLDDLPKSNLHKETQRLINSIMGATNQFVITTLRCPLGQLTNKQIDEGRARLNSAKSIVSNKAHSDDHKLLELTNEFYSLIPHNLGCGARGQMKELLLDSLDKIIQKEYDLDTLLDAKDLNISLTGTSIDDQYKSLDTEFSFIDHSDERFKWLCNMINDTRAHNHKYLGRITLLNAWGITRKGEEDKFNVYLDKIGNECGKQVYPDKMGKLVTTRPDGNPIEYQKANVIPLFHGTRTENLTGILKKGLLIRPSGVVLCGAMYGNGIYHGLSSKACGYTSIKASIWAKGNANNGYLFINDCALGNQLVARGSYQYNSKNILPNHSVHAKGGLSGVINDEFMLYNTNQNRMRYLLEFTCSGGH